MALDSATNFAKATLTTGYDSEATQILLTSGQGGRFPEPSEDGQFNLVWWNSTDYGDPADDPDVEVIRVTATSGDLFFIDRAQEGTSATNHNTGGKTYSVILGFTKKMRDDINAFVGSPHFIFEDGEEESIIVLGAQDSDTSSAIYFRNTGNDINIGVLEEAPGDSSGSGSDINIFAGDGVSEGEVSDIQIQTAGEGYTVGDILYIDNGNDDATIEVNQLTAPFDNLGSEIVSNGSFGGSADDWNLFNNWVYNDNHVENDGTVGQMNQAIDVDQGSLYAVEVAGDGTGQLIVLFANGQSMGDIFSGPFVMTQVLQAGDTDIITLFSNSFNGNVYTVSVKAITPSTTGGIGNFNYLTTGSGYFENGENVPLEYVTSGTGTGATVNYQIAEYRIGGTVVLRGGYASNGAEGAGVWVGGGEWEDGGDFIVSAGETRLIDEQGGRIFFFAGENRAIDSNQGSMGDGGDLNFYGGNGGQEGSNNFNGGGVWLSGGWTYASNMQPGHIDLAPGMSPIEVGNNFVTNGAFDGNADGWDLGSGWSYDDNNVETTGDHFGLSQDLMTVSPGQQYAVLFTMQNLDSSSTAEMIGTIGNGNYFYVEVPPSSEMELSVTITAGSDNTTLTFFPGDTEGNGSPAAFTLTNISVFEIQMTPGRVRIWNQYQEEALHLDIDNLTTDREISFPNQTGLLVVSQEGSGPPGDDPSEVGLLYIDVDNDTAYISTGTNSPADWRQIAFV